MPGPSRRQRERYNRIRRALSEEGDFAGEVLRLPDEIRVLQQTLGNQQVSRLAGEAGYAEIFRQEAETPAPAETTEAAPAGVQMEEAGYRYVGFRSRHIRSLEQDTQFQEARATGMIEIRVWERRRSRRTLRTAEQSAEFYEWLEKKVSNFPGRLRLGEHQYWELNPNSGRLRLVTVHVALETPGEEGQPPGPGVVGTEQDPIYARYYALYGTHAPWVSPEEARMRVWQADPEEARRMRARELMPQYLLWLAVGGERREEGYKVPATWYLNQQPDRLSWSLNEYFTLNAMHGASERMRAMPILAEASANLTNFILTFPIATIKEIAKEGIKIAAEFFFDQLMDYLEENRLVSKEVLDALRVSKETILSLLEFENLIEALLSDEPDVDKGQEAISFVQSLFGRAGAVAEVARGEEAPSPTVEVGMDDAGFWSECGQTRLQEKYFYHFVAANLTYLCDFLAKEGVTDEDVYMTMAREAERMKNGHPLFEE
jgi:hypothetical protein